MIKKLKVVFVFSFLLALVTDITAQQYGDANTKDPLTQFPICVKPVIDHWLRDTWVVAGPNGYYYMTGSTADPDREYTGQVHCWDWNDGIYLWRSKDLKSWKPIGLIWSLEKDGTWQKESKVFIEGEKYPKISINGDPLDNKFRAAWAPELHYIRSQNNWFIVACLNNSAQGSGSFILKSTTGKPEGPYVNVEGNQSKPIFPRIDGSLFEDTDGTVYFVGLNHWIARMKPDMSGLDEELRELQEMKYDPEPYIEGVSIYKHDGKYHLVQAIWSHRMPDGTETYIELEQSQQTRYSYDCMIATADHVYGPYQKRYNAITGGGHNSLFQDETGAWWATTFYNPQGGQGKEHAQTCRPALIPMKYENGKFVPEPTRCEPINEEPCFLITFDQAKSK